MKFGFLATQIWSAQEIVELYEVAEKMGFDYGWVADYANLKSLYPILTAIALKTKKLKLGPCVTNPFTRHPAITATSIATLDELSGGRAILGLGAGDATMLRTLNLERKMPYESIKDTVEIIRKIIGGERVNYEGKAFQIKDFSLFYKPEKVVPIYIGARGKKILELAGKVADGVILDLSHPLEIRLALDYVRKGLKEGKRKRENNNFDFAACPIFSVNVNQEKAKNTVRWMVALIVSNASPEILERHHISQESVKKVKEALCKEGIQKAASLTSDEMLDTFSIAGNLDYCLDALEELKKIGLSQIILGNVGFVLTDVKKEIEYIGREILPRFI